MADETTQGVHPWTVAWWRSLPGCYRAADRVQGQRLDDAWDGLNRDPRFFTGFDGWTRHNMSTKAWESSVGFTRTFRVAPNVPVHLRSWHAPKIKLPDGTSQVYLPGTRVRHTIRDHSGRVIADDVNSADGSTFSQILDGGSVYTTTESHYDGGTPTEPGATVAPVAPESAEGRIIHHTVVTPNRFGVIHVSVQVSVDVTDLRLNERFNVPRATAAAWREANTVLGAGKAGIETDTNSVKIGDGVTPWRRLDYSSTTPAQVMEKINGAHVGPYDFVEAVHVGYRDVTFAQLPELDDFMIGAAYPLLRFLDGMGHQAGWLSDMANAMHRGDWSDPVTAPATALPFLAALLGVPPKYAKTLTAAKLREHLVDLLAGNAPAAGSRTHLAVTAQRYLTGTKQVSVIPAHTIPTWRTPAENALIAAIGYENRIRRLWVTRTPPVPEVAHRWAGVARRSISERLVNGRVTHRNYVLNSGLDTSSYFTTTPGWSWSVDGTVGRTTALGAARITRGGVAGQFNSAEIHLGAKTGRWRASAWVFSPVRTTIRAHFMAYTGGPGDPLNTSGEHQFGTMVVVEPNTWTEVPVTATFTAATTRVQFGVSNPAGMTYVDTPVYVDDLAAAPAAEWFGAYFDGSTRDSVADDVWIGPTASVQDEEYRWVGTARTSAAERRLNGTMVHLNHVRNGGLSANALHTTSTGWSWAHDTTTGRTRPGSARLTRNGAEGMFVSEYMFTTTGTKTWHGSVWVYAQTPTTARARLLAHGAAGADNAADSEQSVYGPLVEIPARSWTQLTVTGTFTGVTARLRLAVVNRPGEEYENTPLWIDDMSAAPEAQWAGFFFDGDTPDSGTYENWLASSPGFRLHTWGSTDGTRKEWITQEYPVQGITPPGGTPAPPVEQLVEAVAGEAADGDRTRLHTLIIRVRSDEVASESNPTGDLDVFAAFLNNSGVIPAGHVIEAEEAASTWDEHEAVMGETWTTVEAASPTWNTHDSAGVALEYTEDAPALDDLPPDPDADPAPAPTPEPEEGDTP